MSTSRTLFVWCALFALTTEALCGEVDSGAKDNAHGDNATRNLAIVQDVVVQSEIAGVFVDPVKCDEDGNVYLRRELDATSGIIKVDPTEKRRVAMFAASSATDWHVSDPGYFAIDSDGNVLQLAYLLDSPDRLVIKFNKDGSHKSSVKLEPPPGFEDWLPTQLAMFGNGYLLVAGHKHHNETHRIEIPFTGVYDSSGGSKKRLY